jgi:Methane/Phenol/Toluene Hydroxylase
MMTTPNTETRSKFIPFTYLKPEKRRATQYEELTLHVQWDPKNFAMQGWFNRDIHGNPAWFEGSTALKAQDWWGYRDPSGEWFRPFVDRQAMTGDSIQRAIEGARRNGSIRNFSPRWTRFLAEHYAAYRFPEYGLFMSLSYAQREALSDVVASPIVFQGLEKDRHAQDIALYCMELEEEISGFTDANCKALWMDSPIWQPTREIVELLMASRDWGEINFVINMIYEPLLATLFTGELISRFAGFHGDSVTPIIAAGAEADREQRATSVLALVKFLLLQDAGNAAVMNGWIKLWAPRVLAAVKAFAPLFEMSENPPQSFTQAQAKVIGGWRAMITGAGLSLEGVKLP